MDITYERCCGIDVHKKMIVACLICGGKQQLRQFGTTTKELRDLSAWLVDAGCQMIAMESTASYWKPLYNIFELSDLNAMVVNAQHMKALPGRKTDVKDAEWIADLLRHGLLKASYIPDREQRELREISRYRKSLIDERSRELNRLQKMLEGANVKLSSVVSAINGKSSRRLLESIVQDKKLDEDEILRLLHPSMHAKLNEIMACVDGIISPLQRRLLRNVLDHIDDMTKRIEDMDKLIKDYLNKYEEAIAAIDEIPGVGRISAETILAEIGLNMNRFPTERHISSWAGVAPGNHESAGKRKSGKTTHGNTTLKAMLVQCAKAAQKTKGRFFSAQYQRIAARRGKSRAAVAVAHSILIAIYYILKAKVPYRELGSEYYNQFNREKKIQSYLKKLAALGWERPTTATT
ncbi:IS110 family RNA-guided transposase [Anaerosinus massiliensis]|uniref:IS110 family transposase n=1 Tax=Massilibacillus massiliensis TaxID=1806837 RepID=UPI000A47BE85|nr:IS110 family transposase [Massilibacillus massiliensis]